MAEYWVAEYKDLYNIRVVSKHSSLDSARKRAKDLRKKNLRSYDVVRFYGLEPGE